MSRKFQAIARGVLCASLLTGAFFAIQACGDTDTESPLAPKPVAEETVAAKSPPTITVDPHPNVPPYGGGPSLALPDLVVSNVTWSSTTSLCGPTLLEIQCGTQYFFQVTVTNRGGTAVPRNTTHLSMSVAGGNLGDLLIPVQLPAGGSQTISYPYYPGPCGGTGSCSIVQVGAWVDRLNTVVEAKENNNVTIVTACKC